MESVHEFKFQDTIRMAYLDMFFFFYFEVSFVMIWDQGVARKHSMMVSANHFDSKCCIILPNLLLIYACVFWMNQQEIYHLEGPFGIRMWAQNIHYPILSSKSEHKSRELKESLNQNIS